MELIFVVLWSVWEVWQSILICFLLKHVLNIQNLNQIKVIHHHLTHPQSATHRISISDHLSPQIKILLHVRLWEMTRISAPIISPIINRLHHRCTMLIYLVQHNANTKRHTKQTSLVVGRFSSEFCFSFYIFVSYINVNFLSRRLRSFVGFSCLLSTPVLRFILNNIFGLLNKHISMDIRKNRILMQCEHREWSFFGSRWWHIITYVSSRRWRVALFQLRPSNCSVSSR